MGIQEFIDSRRYPAQAKDSCSKLLPEVLRDAARQPQQQSHLRCGSLRFSYAEIDLLSDRFAAALLERGVGVGDRVVIVLPNSVEFVIACFAIWKARAIAVPEDISIRPVSLQFILEQTQPTAFLLGGRLAEQLRRMSQALGSVRTLFLKDCAGAPSGLAGIAIESLDAILQSEAPARVLPTGARVDEVVSINYTSGSTGVPKGVMHTHESWLAGAAFTRDYVGVSANDVMVIPLPLHHTYAFRQILAYLLAKGSVVIAADIYSALNLIPEQRPTALLLVPAACNILIDHFASVLHKTDGILRYIEIGSKEIHIRLQPQSLSDSLDDALGASLPALGASDEYRKYEIGEDELGFSVVGFVGLSQNWSEIYLATSWGGFRRCSERCSRLLRKNPSCIRHLNAVTLRLSNPRF